MTSLRAAGALGVVVACLALASGCMGYRRTDARPGEAVIGELAPLTGFFDVRFYQRIRVVAPPGADECRLGTFGGRNSPERRNPPDAAGELLLTAPLPDRGSKPRPVRLVCEVRGAADVRRDVPLVAVRMNARLNGRETPVYRFPPLVHMSLPDGRAVQRWARLREETCTADASNELAMLCDGDAWARLQSLDLGEGAAPDPGVSGD
jgi:hypothetical protein